MIPKTEKKQDCIAKNNNEDEIKKEIVDKFNAVLAEQLKFSDKLKRYTNDEEIVVVPVPMPRNLDLGLFGDKYVEYINKERLKKEKSQNNEQGNELVSE